eukprot:GFUD01037800.1.p1 GENE.GFUD01037800.1~~GFUD01037800.1.p1  ORF type:complete len:313 (-),score=66.54 GFUD01037800.1:207-1145(-)
MPLTSTEIGFKASLEIVSLTILAIPMLYVHLIAGSRYTPYQRGFFCDDQNLKHPYVEEQTVPMEICFLIWAFLITFFVFFIELLRAMSKKQEKLPIFGFEVPWIMIELYRHIGYMTVGATTCFLFTDLSKFTIGRLRPHFLSICNPNYAEICNEGGYEKFINGDDMDICQDFANNITTPKMIREARLSFMSGHSSFSFYCATFLILYLQARLNKFPESSLGFVNITRQILKVLRPFMQFGLFILAFWIALTRISDYFHHPLDVAMGSLVGILFAVGTVIVADIFNKQTAFWNSVGKKEQTKDQDQSNQQELQ